uniref:LITAF domain-containing protein n=1 Tax=Anopheles culicifacies TaxID=139723 RepID=A0A9I3CK13_9DIPT
MGRARQTHRRTNRLTVLCRLPIPTPSKRHWPIRIRPLTCAPRNRHRCQPADKETTVIVTSPQVGPKPTTINCPSCRAHVVTRLEYETTTKTHLCAFLLCCFLCWPCACVPYCSASCRNANHYCPSCGSFIGTHQR